MRKLLGLLAFFVTISSFLSLSLFTTVPAFADTLFNFSGILRNGNGIPIPGMLVYLSGSSSSDQIITGNDGSYALHILPGTYFLGISYNSVPNGSIAPQQIILTTTGVTITGDTVQDITIPTKTLTVTVVDSQNNPVPNANLDVGEEFTNVLPFSLFPGASDASLNGFSPHSTTQTDANGIGHFALLPASTLHGIIAQPPTGSNLSTVLTDPISFLTDTSTTIVLPPTVTYSGVVRNGDGVPVLGMEVYIANSNATNSPSVTFSADDGTYALHVPTGSSYFLGITSNHVPNGSLAPNVYFSLVTPDITITGDTVQDITIPTKDLTVTVLDASGNPLPGAWVVVTLEGPNITLPINLIPGNTGTYSGSYMTGNNLTDSNGVAKIAMLSGSLITIAVDPPAGSSLESLSTTTPFLDDKSITVSYNTNQAPSINSIANSSDNEGDTYTANGSFNDSDSSSWSATVDYGDGSGVQPLPLSGTNFSLSHIYKDNGVYTVTVSITDNQGATGTGTATITVNNSNPSVGTITAPTTPQQVNTPITASAPFTDPGVLDTHTAIWDWGDGTTSTGTVTESNGSGSVSDSHTYTAAEVYTIILTVTDKDGGIGANQFQYVVVYDPAAGYVTGAGTITSLTGAYTADPTLSGKAIFGFVSRYQNGANPPTGSTQFRFIVADFSFKSTSYDWLVIGGARVQYKGSGTINGSGDYGFILTAIDGQISGGGGTDKLRLKVWDKATVNVIYDNQIGASDTTDPTTAIDSGSITIHK